MPNHSAHDPRNEVVAPDDVLAFWLGDGMTEGWPTTELKQRWFLGGAELDAEIQATFGAAVQAALRGELRSWEVSLHDRLALVVLLDQFTRNIFRGDRRAFDGDPHAQQLALATLARHEDRDLPWVARVFLYMPLMHAENLALQRECVACFERLVDDAPEKLKERLRDNLDFARRHEAIIERFGRFPYRNAVLGRENTAEEDVFLKDGPRFGQ
ncbi:MAG: DUF924 family protein [Pseudomonadota bacterium]